MLMARGHGGFLASTGRVLRDFYSTEMGPTVHVDFLLCDHLPKLRLKDCQESAKGINAQIKQSYVSHHLIFGYLRT